MTHQKITCPLLYLVVPCYNEQEVIDSSIQTLSAWMEKMVAQGKILETSQILCVDDGSKDSTWEALLRLHSQHPNKLRALKFAHNAGHQNAVFAGIEYAFAHDADCSISIDADLQDDVHAMEEMVERYCQGFEVVNGVRNDRTTDTQFKRGTAGAYYKLMGKMGVELVPNSADFRLMGRRAMEALLRHPESNLFLRGLVPSLGFKTCNVYYKRLARQAGESKYPLKKMLSLALDGLTSFSTTPIRAISALGIISLLVAFGILVYVICAVILGKNVAGWSSLMISVWFLGGLIMVSLGIIGEYLGRVYIETKHRPRYIIEDELD